MIKLESKELLGKTEIKGRLLSGFDNFGARDSISVGENFIKLNQTVRAMNNSCQKNDKLIKGVRGLAKFLGCGVNKAQQIINSGVLISEKIAYRVGRNWIVKRSELSVLLSENPTIFKKLSTKS